MLEQLQIFNLALIDHLVLSLSAGLNVFTGETGTGKSILIKAVNLLLGEKPSAETIRQDAEEARIEALFSLPPDREIKAWFESAGLPFEDQVVVRKIIQRGGKSRVWINESLIGQTQLNRLTRSLIGISNQHEYQPLLQPAQHLFLLDRFAGLLPLRQEVQQVFDHLSALIQQAGWLAAEVEKRKKQRELWLFQLREIEEVWLSPAEEEELKPRRQVLQQAEKIYAKVHQALQILSESEHSCWNTLAAARDQIRSACSMDPSLEPFFQELEGLLVQLRETVSGLEDYLSRLVFDPQALEAVEERLDRIRRLTVKYGPAVEEVLAYAEEIRARLQEEEEQVFRRRELSEEIAAERKRLYRLSSELAEKRRAAAVALTARVEKELADLGMKACRFEVVFTPVGKAEETEAFAYENTALGRTGLEQGEFHIAPNPGEGLRPLIRIASGGELSRILLVLKKVLSHQDAMETLIFDEVDAGIGGGLGEAVGRKLAELARSRQVICITHLPQIAAFARTHYQVLKATQNQRTRTTVRLLKQEERVAELARMLGGGSASSATVSLAQELLARAAMA